MKKYSVCELFAGVGGLRLGLERDDSWKVIWSNQWEPSTKVQHAADCYLSHFPEERRNPWFNQDINIVTAALEKDHSVIPDHRLLVGGFPCQDYSVATTKAKGMVGKKGVLWWEIAKVVSIKQPEFVLLENVDRLLVSPSNQRGRDMGILLGCFRDLGYSVEWRVINAADYSSPQKRRRVFIFAFRNDTKVAKRLKKIGLSRDWIQKDGFFASEFKVKQDDVDHYAPDDFLQSVQEISDSFSFKFHNAGGMSEGKIYTLKVTPDQELPLVPLSSVLQNKVDDSFYVPDSDPSVAERWEYAKGAKKIERTAKSTGFNYFYSEGAIPFPDRLDVPSRTILTGEGNKSPNRSTHLIRDPRTKRLRTLTPVEVERLNGFEADWTDTGMPISKRYFCMGNALVVGIIARIGRHLRTYIS